MAPQLVVLQAALTHGPAGRTPYWRTLKAGGELNEKYPGGLSAQRRRLEAEGVRVEVRGRRFFVREYTRNLAHFHENK